MPEQRTGHGLSLAWPGRKEGKNHVQKNPITSSQEQKIV